MTIEIEAKNAINSVSFEDTIKATEAKKAINSVSFEDAIKATGFGKFHYKIVIIGSFALLCSYIATSGISFIIPASQCDLKMDSYDKGNLISANFLGIALSCHVWGFLSDTLGRHYILSKCLLVDGILYIITSLTPNYSLIVTWRIMSGFASCGAIVSLYAYIGEFFSDCRRIKALLIMTLLACIAYSILPVFAWLILPGKWSLSLHTKLLFKSWRMYYACSGLPSLICSFFLFFLPESPRFLAVKGEQIKALEILQRIHKENLKPNEKSEYQIKSIVLNESDNIETPYTSSKSKIRAFFSLVWNQTIPIFKSPYRSNMFLICLSLFLLYACNNGMNLWLPEILNRLSIFKKKFNNKPATYCDVMHYQSNSLKPNISEEKYFPFLRNTTGNIVNDVTFNQVEKVFQGCQEHLDTSVYMILLVFSIITSLVMAIVVGLSYLIDKTYLVVLLITICFFATVFLLVIRITEFIPILSGIIIVLSGIAISTINSISVDYFPTNLRGMAGCFTLMFSRLGTISVNTLIGTFIDSYCSVLLWAYIFSFGVCFILIVFLPKKR